MKTDRRKAFYRTTPEGRLLQASEGLLELLGYPDMEAMFCVNTADVYVNTADRLRWQHLLRESDMISFRMQDRKFDGSIIHVSDTARVVRAGNGIPLWYEGELEPLADGVATAGDAMGSSGDLPPPGETSEGARWKWTAAGGLVWSRSSGLISSPGPDPTVSAAGRWWVARTHPDDVEASEAWWSFLGSGTALQWWSEYRIRRTDGSYGCVHDRGWVGRRRDGSAVEAEGVLIPLPDFCNRCVGDASSFARPRQASDPQLVQWIAEGNEQALQQLYGRHAGSALLTAELILGQVTHAEDVVADVFSHIWQHATRYEPGRGEVGAWIFALTRARARDYSRRRSRRAALEHRRHDAIVEHTMANAPHSAAEALAKVARRDAVRHALISLPDRQRRPLEMSLYGGLSHRQIAERLGDPIGTVKTRIRAGLAALRQQVLSM